MQNPGVLGEGHLWPTHFKSVKTGKNEISKVKKNKTIQL